MKIHGILVKFWLSLSIFLMAVSFTNARELSEGIPYNVMKGDIPITEEGIVRLTLPIQIIKPKIIEALETDGTQIKKINRLDFDPIKRLVMLEGVAELPADIVFDMNDIAGAGDFPVEHQFNLSFKLGSAKKLAKTRYFSIEVVEFKLDGHSYLNAFHRLSQYLVGLLVNTSFMNYMLDVKPEMAMSEDNLSIQIKQLIEKKGLRFRGNTISFKLDLAQIPQLSDFAGFEDLRLWQFSPVLFKGSNEIIALRVEAGLGIPAKSWFDNVKSRLEFDSRTLSEVRKELYQEYSNTSVLKEELSQFIETKKKDMGLVALNTREQNAIEKINTFVDQRIRKNLTLKNPLFEADPEETYELTKRDAKEYIINSLSHLKVKYALERKVRAGGRNAQGLPFIEKRLSQTTMSQAVRFFRDFEFNNEQMFPEIEVVFAPHIPGVILRGIMNMDINFLMEMGLEGSGIEWSKTPWRAAPDIWGAGMPFEISLRMQMLDEGWLGLDVENFSILSGSEKTYLSKATGHGAIMANWTKMAIVNTLATMLIEDPTASTPGEAPVEDNSYEKLIKKIDSQGSTYRQMIQELSDGNLKALVDMAKIDIEKNPFIETGKEEVQGRAELFFKNLIVYDEKDELLKIKLDPRVVSDTILASENNVQVWNMEPIFDKKLNQVYLDLAVGNQTRTKGFLNNLLKRQENQDSQEFVGIDETREFSKRDLNISLNLKSFESLVNGILADAFQQQRKDVKASLQSDSEQSYYLIQDLNLSVVKDGVLKINTTISHITKSKRAWINPARWFGDTWPVKQKTISASVVARLSVDELSKYKDEIEFSENEIFLGNEVLKLDLLNAGVKFEGQTSVLDKIVNLVASDIDFKSSSVAKKLKTILINFSKGYLHSQDPNKNGSTQLAGIRINKFVKLFGHKEELLIQLNPHAMAVAFDIRLLPNQKQNGVDLGLNLKKSKNTISFDFSTSGNMASVDKGEMLRVMAKAIEITNPYLNAKTPEEFKKLMRDNTLFDRLVYNSDYTKLSMFHRLSKLLSNYSGVSDIVKPDTSVVEQINAQIGSEFGLEGGKFNSTRITASGVELMYFLSSSLVLSEIIMAVVNKAKELDVYHDVNYINVLESKADELKKRFVEPLFLVYEENFHKQNRKIVEKGITDWNHTYYPDAIYCDSVYNLLKSWEGIKEVR